MLENRTMDENEATNSAVENAADEGADAAVTEEIEALREAFRKGWDKALSYRQERREAYGEEEAAPAAAEAADNSKPSIEDPITVELDDRSVRVAARKTLLAHVMGGPDLASWIVPQESVESDALLAEHLAQLRKAVRFALSLAVDDQFGIGENLSAANTATRMIRANIALAKELNASKSKTVRGGMRARRTQD
jgi:hypothetical protein